MQNVIERISELRIMSPQERTDLFYEQYIGHLKQVVTQANIAWKEGNTQSIWEIIDNNASSHIQDLAYQKLNARQSGSEYRKKVNVYKSRKNIDLLMAEVIKIEHSHSNYLAETTQNPERQIYLDRAQKAYLRYEDVAGTIDFIPFTISGEAIDWVAQRKKEYATTLTLTGQRTEAAILLYDEIDRLKNVISHTPTLSRHLGPDDQTKQIAKYVDLLNRRGLMLIQVSKLENNLGEMMRGIEDIKSAHEIKPNYELLTAVSLELLKAGYLNKTARYEAFINLKECLRNWFELKFSSKRWYSNEVPSSKNESLQK